MEQKFAFNAPFNPLSMGQVSICFLHEMFEMGLKPFLFPIGGQVDRGSFEIFPHLRGNDKFFSWFEECVSSSLTGYTKDMPCIKFWHLNGSLESHSNSRQILITNHELGQVTKAEINAVKNQHIALFSSEFARKTFENAGCSNVGLWRHGFDNNSFKKIEKRFHRKGEIVFNLSGKFEHRKQTGKIMSLWGKKYGNQRNYTLNCAISNPFLKPETLQHFINVALDGKRYYNINILPHMKTNDAYNDYMNSCHIDLTGLSGGEGWNLPAFQETCLGKWSVVLDAHAHKDWANKDNSILVEPDAQFDCVDNVFFSRGGAFNQGFFYTASDEKIIAAMEEGEKRVGVENIEGEKLKDVFSYKKAMNELLKVTFGD